MSIRFENRDDVVIATMVHGKANALDLELCTEVVAALDELAATARAVVLTGTGTIFSAGVDLIRLCEDTPDYRDRFVPALSQLVLALFTFPKPLVAAVNGHAIAGGCIIACTADHRIMARGSARIGVPELLVGVAFPTAALEVMRFALPPHRIQAVIYGGATCAPDEARELGLVDQVVGPDALIGHAVAAADRLAAVPAEVFALTKRQLRAPALATIQANAARDLEVVPIWKDPVTLDRVRDYIARTFRPRDQEQA